MADQFATGVSPPEGASYKSPLLDFSALGNLPATYDAADIAAANRDTRNAFRNGIPKVAGTSIPDYGAMADTLAKARAPTGMILDTATTGLKLQMLQGNDAALGGGPQADNTGSGDYYSRSAQSESGGNPNAKSQTSSSKGTYGFTDQTRTDIAQKYGINPQDDASLMKAFTQDNGQKLQAAGIQPTDRNLRMAHFLGADGAISYIKNLSQNPNAPAYQLVSPEAARANQSVFFDKDGKPLTALAVFKNQTQGYSGETAAFAGGGRPAGGTQVAQVGRSDVQPVDINAPAGAPQVQQPGVPQRVAPLNQPGAQTPASALVPPAWVGHEQQYANQLMRRAAALATLGDKPGAEVLQAQAKAVNEALSKGAEMTPAQKDYQSDRRPGESMVEYQSRVAGTKKGAEDDVSAYQKRYGQIQALGEQAKTGIQKAELGKRLVEESNFYSGPFEPTSRTFKQFASVLGADPNKAMPQEAFNKIVNDMLQEQVKAMGQSGVGRVLQSEVNIMRQAIASLGVTPATNRLLLEMVSRTYEKQMDIAKIARQFKPTTPGTYNQDLDDQINNYLDRHPMFSKQEYEDPRLIAPPTFKTPQDMQGAGLARGTPFRVKDRGDKIFWAQ
jgi:hypothetical protein